MTQHPIPDEALAQHIAVLGKTGSGKTSTGKTIVEHVVEQGSRVCILDPIKSDWWGLTSSVDGRAPGLPFQILGGPHGHVPLHSGAGRAVAEIVANGTLPLSIVDMAHFDPGGHQRFFVDFAQALHRRMRGVVYLVLEEAHIFAPKERSGIGNENMAIHWAKMLATAGRSKGIRLILMTQRTQALHNALLGSCETLVAHRLTAPADQKPVIDWLKANVEKELAAEIASSLSGQKTGTAWVCSGEAGFFQQIAFPPIQTFDNSATPTDDDMDRTDIQMAPVDVAKLRDMIGQAIEEAEADDPKKLKDEIKRLQNEVRHAKAAEPADTGALQLSHDRGKEQGYKEGLEDGYARGVNDANECAQEFITNSFEEMTERILLLAPKENSPTKKVNAQIAHKPAHIPAPKTGNLSDAQQRVLNAIAWWEKIGIAPAERVRACVVAGYSPKASTFGVYVSQLVQMGLVYTEPGKIGLTDEGRETAYFPDAATKEDLRSMAAAMLGPREREVFAYVYDNWPSRVSRRQIADKMGLSPSASTTGVYISKVMKFGMIENAGPGQVRACDWLFPAERQAQ